VRLNLSKSGVGFGVGPTGLRWGLDAKRRKYFSVGLPGTGLSYRSSFGRPVSIKTLRKIGYAAVSLAILAVLALVLIHNGWQWQ